MPSLSPRIDLIDYNYIINGGFRYWQRGGIASAINTSTTFAYAAADRWLHRHTGTFTGTPNVQRSATSPSNNLSEFSLIHTFRRNAAAATMEHQQRIESIFARKLVAKGKMSLSFYINASLDTGSVRVRIAYPTAVDDHASQTEFYNSGLITVGTAATWQKVELENISVDANCLNGMAVFIEYSLPSGTDGANQDVRLAQVNLTNTLKVSDFTPSGGDDFQELLFCQRYFEKTYNVDVAVATVTNEGREVIRVWNADICHHNVRFKIFKRINPSIVFYNPLTGATGTWGDAVTLTMSVVASTAGASGFHATTNTPGTTGTTTGHYTADAEIS